MGVVGIEWDESSNGILMPRRFSRRGALVRSMEPNGVCWREA